MIGIRVTKLESCGGLGNLVSSCGKCRTVFLARVPWINWDVPVRSILPSRQGVCGQQFDDEFPFSEVSQGWPDSILSPTQ